jgi:hypothetical protein
MHRVKVPAIIVCSVVFLGIGVAAGLFVMAAMGYRTTPQTTSAEFVPGKGGGAGKGGGGGGGGGKMGGGMPGSAGGAGGPPGSGGMPGMMGAGMTPSSKTQLATLVAKLDVLTAKPLYIELGDEQKKKIREQLQGLADMETVSDEEAKKRLDALLEILKDQQATMEAAGYRWPNQAAKQDGKEGANKIAAKGAGAPKPFDPSNPFKDEQNGKRLRDLDARLAGAAAKSP